MISFGCLPRLKALLDSPRKALRKEACWAISNITAGNREQIEEVISCGIVPELVKLLNTAEFEVKREAAWAISNAASGGNVRQVAALVEAKCMAPLVTLLDVHDQKIVAVALEAIENILRTGKTRMEEEMLAENPYIGALEEVTKHTHLSSITLNVSTSLRVIVMGHREELDDTRPSIIRLSFVCRLEVSSSWRSCSTCPPRAKYRTVQFAS